MTQVQTTPQVQGALKYETREDWLNAFIDAARAKFEEVGAPLPINVRVAIGFTSRGFNGSRIGECWSDSASEDGHFEIFIKPTLDNSARICDVLTHELIHAAVGLAAGHGVAFRRVAVALGLKGKMTATYAGEDWYRWAIPVIEQLGPFPYGQITAKGQSSARPKQATSLLKVECDKCGFLARVTKKYLGPNPALICPVPTCTGRFICEA